jgi:hypothetical protein
MLAVAIELQAAFVAWWDATVTFLVGFFLGRHFVDVDAPLF